MNKKNPRFQRHRGKGRICRSCPRTDVHRASQVVPKNLNLIILLQDRNFAWQPTGREQHRRKTRWWTITKEEKIWKQELSWMYPNRKACHCKNTCSWIKSRGKAGYFCCLSFPIRYISSPKTPLSPCSPTLLLPSQDLFPSPLTHPSHKDSITSFLLSRPSQDPLYNKIPPISYSFNHPSKCGRGLCRVFTCVKPGENEVVHCLGIIMNVPK